MSAPVVYLLHGEDDFEKSGFLSAMKEKLGDPSTAEMNYSAFEIGEFDLEAVRAVAMSGPFLAPRRMVVVQQVSKKLRAEERQEKFLAMLDQLPATTAMVLIESSTLKASHWLMKWAKKAGERAYLKAYNLPKGGGMAAWIRQYAAKNGGEITHQAASLLGENVREAPRMAASEVDKLLAYVNYARPIDVDDVESAAAFVYGQADYFKFIDAIAVRNGRKAMELLKNLLDEQDPIQLFFSLVGHFRLVLQTRELVEDGGTDGTVAKDLSMHPFRAKKMVAQARTLSLPALERMYLRLQQIDSEIKTGKMRADLALETLVMELTQ